ncbi:fumarylacetoacetate hydrolase family protein [Streptomyces prasinus]|uniref:fumarylacetoacetate hydrolase family protein n=1 Tax=Streptomyces prasinus TaxID=67345 RepID=UPI0039C8905E
MRFGVLDDRLIAVLPDGAAHDVTALAGPPAGPAGPLQRLIERGRPLSAAEVRSSPAVDVGGAAWDAPLPFPRKVIGAPANYRAHVAEMGNPNTIVEWGVFLKASTSVIGPGRTVELPYTDVRTDQEGELAVVIGKEARHVSASDALDHVFGYTCVLDITTRSTEDRSTRKSYDTFTPPRPAGRHPRRGRRPGRPRPEVLGRRGAAPGLEHQPDDLRCPPAHRLRQLRDDPAAG